MNAFWILFMLIALQPVLQRKMLDASRRRMLSKIESSMTGAASR